MSYTSKKKDKTAIIYTITLTPEEYAADLDAAVQKIQAKMDIKGFRKGKAPVDVVKREVGEMGILQDAVEGIVSKAYIEMIQKEELDTLGAPKIQLEKLAPGNDIVFTAEVSLLPEVKLPDLKKISVEKRTKEVADADVDETMKSLLGMHAEEKEKDGPAEGTDKLLLDMNMKVDGVGVEGGQATDHQVYLSEDHYIPGFNEQVAGLKKGEEKEFTLDFPADHYQKQLAGKKVDVSVTVKSVSERILPELTDEFAKKLGQESAAELKSIVKSNMQAEADNKGAQAFEIELLDTIIEKTKFDAIPDVLLDAERQKIFHELTRDLDKHGVTVAQYLGDLKKTEEELLADFTEQADKRAKAALVSREVAKAEELSPSESEINEEIQKLREMYANDAETMKALERVEVRDTIAVQMQNRKVMEWLKENVAVKGEKKKKATKKSTKKDAADHVHGPDCDHA